MCAEYKDEQKLPQIGLIITCNGEFFWQGPEYSLRSGGNFSARHSLQI